MHWYLEVLKQYAVFGGRSRRTEFWSFVLFHLIILIVLRIIDGFAGTSVMISTIYVLGVLLPMIAVSVRRLHDTDRSGWWLLAVFFPFLGVIVLLLFMAQDSDPKSNQYGSCPKQAII
ncbi:MAG: DUF805 domain-containing protein [Balneolaceae bacterium]|nr:MAG: DUF805 domain-containing protein [Balneolaceae bacterium]